MTDTVDSFDLGTEPVKAPAKPRAEKPAAKPRAERSPDTPAALAAEGRMKIILEENDEIPPSGQYIGVNGVGYLLVPGEIADVPVGVVSVLNDAVRDKPVVQDGRVLGYRKALRFPYRVIN